MKRRVGHSAYILVLLMLCVVGCGGENDLSGGNSPDQSVSTWSVSETSTSDCANQETSTSEVTLIQNGTFVSLVYTKDCALLGSLQGNTLSLKGTCEEDSGTTTFSNWSGTVSEDIKTITGNATWSWTDGQETCKGTSTFTVTKQIATQP